MTQGMVVMVTVLIKVVELLEVGVMLLVVIQIVVRSVADGGVKGDSEGGNGSKDGDNGDEGHGNNGDKMAVVMKMMLMVE